MVNDGILTYDQRIVITMRCRLEMLEKVHDAHQGVVKCKARARRSMWWPSMMAQIKEMVEKCKTCRIHSPTPTEPLQPSSLPERPWQRLGADLFEFKGQQFVIVVDYYSRWIEVRKLTSMNSRATIESLKSIISTHGIPDCIISDNGPQFASKEFYEFTKEYGFSHITSSPRYPKANGEAEHAVKTIKTMWSKSADPHKSLLSHRTTPLDNDFSLSELQMSRQLQSSLPTVGRNLLPESVQKVRSAIEGKEGHNKQQSIRNHDSRHRAKELSTLHPQQHVYVRDMNKEGVVRRMIAPHSYEVETDTSTIRRNRAALVPTDGAEVQGLTRSANPASHLVGDREGGHNGAEVPGLTRSANPASRSVTPSRNERPTRVMRMLKYLDDYILM